jgi:hypothetical protein
MGILTTDNRSRRKVILEICFKQKEIGLTEIHKQIDIHGGINCIHPNPFNLDHNTKKISVVSWLVFNGHYSRAGVGAGVGVGQYVGKSALTSTQLHWQQTSEPGHRRPPPPAALQLFESLAASGNVQPQNALHVK